MHHPTDRIAHTTAFVTPVVEHWLEREIAQWTGHNVDAQHCVMDIFMTLGAGVAQWPKTLPIYLLIKCVRDVVK